jgi:hypothetical protein
VFTEWAYRWVFISDIRSHTKAVLLDGLGSFPEDLNTVLGVNEEIGAVDKFSQKLGIIKGVQKTQNVLYHAFIAVHTPRWVYTFEKVADEIIVARIYKVDDGWEEFVTRQARRSDDAWSDYRVEARPEARRIEMRSGRTTIHNLFHRLDAGGVARIPYRLWDHNCQEFTSHVQRLATQ